jgi:putative membrane protein
LAWFSAHYEVLRAIHIVAVVAWMAGLMYLPRLYVYHSSAPLGSELDQTLVTMERRLLRGIMHPSAIVVWLLGLGLIVARGGIEMLSLPWLQIKLSLVFGISIIHLFYTKWQLDFARGRRPLNHIAFRILNELPFLLMIFAVLAVVLEPNFTH